MENVFSDGPEKGCCRGREIEKNSGSGDNQGCRWGGEGGLPHRVNPRLAERERRVPWLDRGSERKRTVTEQEMG